MQVDAREILFIRENGPKWLTTQIAENTGKTRNRVKNHFYGLRKDYDEDIIEEARRLLKVACGLEYNPSEHESSTQTKA